MKYFRTRFFLCILLFGVAHFMLAQKSKNNWADHESLKNAHVAYQFSEIESGKNIDSYQKAKLLNPASTIKLLTSLIFLDEFGENFQGTTSVFYTGTIEKDGTLKGDIIYYSDGDPTVGSARYGEKNSLASLMRSIVLAIKKEGITCIDGDIITDASYFGNDCTPHNWQYNDLGNYYASGCWSTNINENAYKLTFSRSTNINEKPKLKEINPDIPGLTFDNMLRLGKSGSGDQAYIFCAPYQKNAIIRGSYPIGATNFSIRGSIPDAPLFISQSIQSWLEASGIKSQGCNVRYNKVTENKQAILTKKGIPASQQVRSAIHKSINLYCEAHLLQLGRGNRETGINEVVHYLQEKNCIDREDDIMIRDGSGLSQRNFISPEIMVQFIIEQRKALGPKALNNYLARNGYEGTLKNTFVRGGLKGAIHGKSGSMGGVRAYAGILKTKNKKELAFSIMVNNFTAPSNDITRHIERLLQEVYDEN